MICVECDQLVPSLHTSYKNGHIKLTDCQNCGQVADKYVEYDNVLLFIDILLSKPQAYKHLVYNLVSDANDLAYVKWKIQRIRFLSILFEIYLTWAYKEKEVSSASYKNPHSIYHVILAQKELYQYLLFALKCISDDLITHFFVHTIYLSWLKWIPKSYQVKKPISEEDKQRLKTVLSMTILISGGMKLFPILMLIWKYDNAAITSTIGIISNINLVEALRIVTNLSFSVSAAVFFFMVLLKSVITKTLLILVVSKFDPKQLELFANSERVQLLCRLESIKSFFLA